MAKKKVSRQKGHRHPMPSRQYVRGGSPTRAGPGWKPAADPDEQALRDRTLEFTYQSRFREDFDRAMSHFWDAETLRSRTLVQGDPQIAVLHEWYIHDFMTGEGERIIDLFAREVGPALPPRQRSMLQDWCRSNRLRLLEIQDVTPGVGETVQDLLSGEVLECWDITTSYAARQWHVLLTRVFATEGRWHFSGTVLIMSPFDKDDILDYARNLWDEYQREYPTADILDFYRDRSLDLYHFGKKLEKDSALLRLSTPEGHTAVRSVAEYRVRDPDEIVRCLDQAEEFEYAGPDAESPPAAHYIWLLRGRSFVPEAAVKPRKGIQVGGEWTRGPGEPRYRTLGEITLWSRRLELVCLSRERLEAGKRLLEEYLGESTIHRRDRFKDVAELMAEAGPARPVHEVPDKTTRAIAREVMEAEAQKWLDTPVPLLGNRTPRDAAKTAEGRELVKEALKRIEFLQRQRAEIGEPYVDMDWLRRELGL